MSGPLHLDVLVVSYKPIVGLIPPMGEGGENASRSSKGRRGGEARRRPEGAAGHSGGREMW
jgi:hypothetical protein